jgi:hypothetical protein
VLAGAEEVVVPFRVGPGKVSVATHFKSTWLTASIDGLKARGHYARYAELLAARHRETILHAIAGVWLPMEVAQAHYAACDALLLTQAEQVAMGREVLSRLRKTIFSLAFRAARDIGVTPWTLLKLLPAQFDREVRGGACGVFRVGPKDARIELIGFPLSSSPYTRAGLRGLAHGLCEPLCSKVYTQELRELCSATTIAYRVAWA